MLLQQAPRQQRWLKFSDLLWLALFVVLNAFDLLTTYIDLQAGLREGNPLMRTLLQQGGFGALIFYKVLMVVVVSLGIVLLYRGYPKLAHMTLGICNVLVLAVVISNVIQYQL
jgi:hypothetical protein